MEHDDQPTLEEGLYGIRLGTGVWSRYRRQVESESATDSDGKSARFVLYSGKEVRPDWRGGLGDIIATREFRLANYRRNPVVLADHDPNKVIGRGTASIVADGEISRLEGAVQWDLHEANPLGILIASQHARGMRSAVSIGFMPGKGSGPRTALPKEHAAYVDPEKTSAWMAGWYHRSPELYEWSSVSVPKDPEALQLQSQLREWARESEDPAEQRRRILSELTDSEAASLVERAFRTGHQPIVDELDRLVGLRLQAAESALVARVLTHLPNPAASPAPKATDWWQELR